MTLAKLEYYLYLDDENSLIYRKILGDSDITLEIDKRTNDVKKFVNDFRKKVMVEPETIERLLMENAARGILD